MLRIVAVLLLVGASAFAGPVQRAQLEFSNAGKTHTVSALLSETGGGYVVATFEKPVSVRRAGQINTIDRITFAGKAAKQVVSLAPLTQDAVRMGFSAVREWENNYEPKQLMAPFKLKAIRLGELNIKPLGNEVGSFVPTELGAQMEYGVVGPNGQMSVSGITISREVPADLLAGHATQTLLDAHVQTTILRVRQSVIRESERKEKAAEIPKEKPDRLTCYLNDLLGVAK